MLIVAYFVLMHTLCIMYDGKGTAMRLTSSTRKPSDVVIGCTSWCRINH